MGQDRAVREEREVASAVRSPRGQRSAIGVSAERQEVLKHFNGLRNTASNITGIFETRSSPKAAAPACASRATSSRTA